MTVRIPIQKEEEKQNVDVDYLISKGASVKQDKNEDKKRCAVNMRLPGKLIREIDDEVKKRLGMTRTGWILEAIHEKLTNSKT